MPKRCTVWILGDQLLDDHPALKAAREAYADSEIQILLIENENRIRRHPYHRKKLVLLLSAMRHYAQTLKDRGHKVSLVKASSLAGGLREHSQAWKPEHILTMAASEWRGRTFQTERLEEIAGCEVSLLPNTQFLVGRFNPVPDPEPGKRYVLGNFYKEMRAHFDLLMDGGNPVGDRWNFDKENRKRLPESLEAPQVPGFSPDEITREAVDEARQFDWATGSVEGFDLAVTSAQARQAFDDFLEHRLPNFGDYQDAMSRTSGTLFHSLISPYLNLGLLEPLELARRAERAYHDGKAPLNSVEGFIRQIIGWREYMYWVYWRFYEQAAELNFWKATRPLPEMFWDGKTEMNCMRLVLERIERSGYAHHIERLMILANFSLLSGLHPQKVNDWFLCNFIDAYEWVMVPNVFGMGLHADGGLTATKPYIASANYINKMGDYCSDCSFDPRQRTGEGACPYNTLYWNFLIKNEEILRKNPRMGRNVLGLRYLDEAEREQIRAEAERFLSHYSPDG